MPTTDSVRLCIQLLTIEASDQKGELEGLLFVESRVAEGGVVQAQVLLGQALCAADALGDGLAGQFEVHAAEVRVHGAVNV